MLDDLAAINIAARHVTHFFGDYLLISGFWIGDVNSTWLMLDDVIIILSSVCHISLVILPAESIEKLFENG